MRASVIVLYFFVGFFIGTASFMVLTALLKPWLMSLDMLGRTIGFLAPPLLGLVLGFRTALFGHRYRLSLAACLKRACGLA